MIEQFLVNGFINGCIYALLALGFALVYNTTRIFHIAYAALYMVAPYFFYSFYNISGINLIVSVFLAILLSIVVGLIVELLIYRPLNERKASLDVIMISSIGAMILIINVIALFYGNETKILNNEIAKSISIGYIIITKPQLIQIGVSLILIAAFLVFLKFSQFGMKTRAIRDNTGLSRIFGIKINRYRTILFTLSTLFAATGGILSANDFGMNPYVGMPMLLNAVVALIIGGTGRFHTAVIGGILLGLLQAFVVWKFSTNWQEAVTFGVLMLFLLFRPQGLFGLKQRKV